MEVFGAVLREYRLRAELTQEQLAFEADIQRKYVSMLELGQHQPTLTTLFALAAALKCSPSELLAEVELKLKKTRRSNKKAANPVKTHVNNATDQGRASEATDRPHRRPRRSN
ncbi:helix-turn-helix domain-containing protein [Paraburkholderia sp. EG286B]|uniref:helix-turn-helix domain-containing protein n=1 Tax=Paraburkholderia sp. EG286B TaxID=3237011 RepID=UPI0034D2BD82